MAPLPHTQRVSPRWAVVFCALLAPHVSWAQNVNISMMAPAPAPRFNGARAVGVYKGKPFLHRLAVTGDAPLTFAAQNLPAGLTLDAATGIISGPALAAGDYRVEVSASNAAGMAKSTLRIVSGETVALTPPIGWNSYDSFDDAIKESEFIEQATWTRDHLQPFGWDLVVVDFRWYDPDAPGSDQSGNGNQLVLDANGRYQPATNRFPKGFKYLAEQAHAMGLKFGIHIMRGIPRRAVNNNLPIAGSNFTAKDAVRGSNDNGYVCVWNADMYGVKGDTAAGQAWYDSIFAQYAEWGIDFVKVDDTTKNRPDNQLEYFQSEVQAIQNAIQKSGRSIVLSLSPGEALKSAEAHLTKTANMWRMSDDYWDRWTDLQHMFDLSDRWETVGGAGHWPDADMLPLGALGPHCPVDGTNRSTRFTKNEQQLMMSLWATLPSPYILGANLVNSAKDSFFLGLVQNPEIVDVQQDALGKKAKKVVSDSATSIWSRELSGGKLLVSFFNRTGGDKVQSVPLSMLDVTDKRLVRNAWQRTDLPAVMATDKLEVTTPTHAATLLVLSPETPPPLGGSGGMGGMLGTGGATSDAGAATGGVAGTVSGGAANVAGAAQGGSGVSVPSVAGQATAGASTTPRETNPVTPASDSGCGCIIVGKPEQSSFLAALAGAAALWLGKRRRKRKWSLP